MGALHSALLASLLICAVATPAIAQETPQRRLVYNFTVGVQNDTHDTDSQLKMNNVTGGDVLGTGDTSYMGVGSDKGTIPVDVMGVEPDGGLVVKVSENGQNNRKATPVECVVYPTTNVICASGEVYPEELTVIRTLSPKFFDPSTEDAQHHWHQGSDAAGVSLNFTAGTPAGTVIPISEIDDEKVQGGQGSTLHGTDTYSYDMAKSVPTQLKEYDTIRKQMGPGQYSNIIIDITAELATDSGVSAAKG
jgi:hypothetical protein